ncbi:MAG: hypothetical protein J1E34_03325 [Oscillospiraceae bacterium]|nr:hypothetical protein [Oscillospiraceae bacterium]
MQGIHADSAFSAMFSFIKDVFISVITWLDNIYIFGNISILDLNIAFTVFGVLFTAVFAVVKSSVSNSISSSDKSRKKKEQESD